MIYRDCRDCSQSGSSLGNELLGQIFKTMAKFEMMKWIERRWGDLLAWRDVGWTLAKLDDVFRRSVVWRVMGHNIWLYCKSVNFTVYQNQNILFFNLFRFLQVQNRRTHILARNPKLLINYFPGNTSSVKLLFAYWNVFWSNARGRTRICLRGKLLPKI